VFVYGYQTSDSTSLLQRGKIGIRSELQFRLSAWASGRLFPPENGPHAEVLAACARLCQSGRTTLLLGSQPKSLRRVWNWRCEDATHWLRFSGGRARATGQLTLKNRLTTDKYWSTSSANAVPPSIGNRDPLI